ncbi:unnamed protein product, partial [Iphiclides podalirius]
MVGKIIHVCILSVLAVPRVSASFPAGIINKSTNVTKKLINKCGIDKSRTPDVGDGEVYIEEYPWFGVLVYPLKGELTSSPVILITKQLVLGAAIEIANLPKIDFRSKVILGHNCTGPRIKVRDYTYHPDFLKSTFSSLVLIQLDVGVLRQDLRPICPPPDRIHKPHFYAVSLPEDCMSSKINVYKMTYVDNKECKTFYRRSGLDIQSVWPKYTVCAKALGGGECLWQSGVFLVVKQDGRWMLVGFGVHGPGCESPARFLDYGMYHQWVRTNIERIGTPAITRVAPNEIIMRRRMSNVQRFGPCDPEEKIVEIYTDHTAIMPEVPKPRTAIYNFTILARYEYSCIVFRGDQDGKVQPTIHLKRLCLATRPSCYQFSTLQIDFEVHMKYFGKVEYHVNVYGEPLRVLDTKRMNVFSNLNEIRPNISATYTIYKY